MKIPEEVREAFSYDPLTGDITRLVDRGKAKAGQVLNTKHNSGYLCVRWGAGRIILLHRLAWFLHTGEQPPVKIDHLDCDGTNNRWDNLRATDNSQNSCNARLSSRNTTGVKGLSRHSSGAGWYCQIMSQGKVHYKYFPEHERDNAIAWLEALRPALHREYARAA